MASTAEQFGALLLERYELRVVRGCPWVRYPHFVCIAADLGQEVRFAVTETGQGGRNT